MKYLKTYESFKTSKKDTSVNEGILGNLFGKLKNKLSLGFSKSFGSASEVDKLIEEYKGEVMKAEEEKKKVLQSYANYLKSIKDGGEKDVSKEKEIDKNYQKTETNYEKQLGILKQKFDIKFKDIMDGEENKKIINYVTLKKLEMQQELLKNELSIVLTDAGLKEEDVQNDPFFQKLSKGIQSKIEGNIKLQDEQTKTLSQEGGGGEGSSFDFEKAKANPKDYKWEDSKFVKDYKFETGEELKYFKSDGFEKNGDDYKGTTAWVMADQKDDEGNVVKGGEIRVTTNKEDETNKGFVIAKSKVISTSKSDEEATKEEEKPKEEEKSEV